MVSRSAGSGLLLSWWGSALDWQVADLAATRQVRPWSGSGHLDRAEPAAERIAALRREPHCSCRVGWTGAAFVEALRTPVYWRAPVRNVRRKLLPSCCGIRTSPTATTEPAAVEGAVLGAMNSVRDYYLENSDGLYTIESAGVLGWVRQ